MTSFPNLFRTDPIIEENNLPLKMILGVICSFASLMKRGPVPPTICFAFQWGPHDPEFDYIPVQLLSHAHSCSFAFAHLPFAHFTLSVWPLVPKPAHSHRRLYVYRCSPCPNPSLRHYYIAFLFRHDSVPNVQPFHRYSTL